MTIKIGRSICNFSQIPNETLRDKNLSYEARGMLCMLLSHKEGWVVYKSYLQEQGDIGRDKVTRILRELQDHGYAKKIAKRKEDGSLDGWDWEINDLPSEELVNRTTENPSVGKTPPKNTNLIRIQTNKNTNASLDDDTDKNPKIKIDELKNLWNEFAEVNSLPRWVGNPAARTTSVRARVSEYKDQDLNKLDRWKEFLLFVSSSDFLMGKTDQERKFTLKIDWLLKPSNFAKVIEGNYHH